MGNLLRNMLLMKKKQKKNKQRVKIKYTIGAKSKMQFDMLLKNI